MRSGPSEPAHGAAGAGRRGLRSVVGLVPLGAGTVLASLAGLLAAAAVPSAPAAAQLPRPSEVRMDGPYGLWVEESEGRVTVRWITAETAPGRLEVLADGRRLTRIRTDGAEAHRASFELPEGPAALLLRYGAAGAEPHETRVRLPLDPPRAGAVSAAPDSVYVVGDVHGAYEQLRRLLRHVGLVDSRGRWSGGRAHLVFLGDLVDRGWDVTRVLWWIYELEAGARRAGGRVHVVVGNHELMLWTADLRYVHGKERELARLHGVPYERMLNPGRSVLGRWLASKPAVLRLDDLLLAHGGVGPAYEDWSVEAIDDSMAAWMREPLFRRLSDTTVAVPPMDSAAVARRLNFFLDAGTPFWYRGWLPPGRYGGDAAGRSQTGLDSLPKRGGPPDPAAGGAPADSVADRLEAMLDRYGASRHVVAHTPLERVTALFGGNLLATDLVRPATELLLLVRLEGGWRPYRWGLEGGPEALE